MKQWFHALVLLGLCSGCSFADARPGGCWEVGAHALYWVPCAPIFRYAVTNYALEDGSNLVIHGCNFDAEWGVKVDAKRTLTGCLNIWASYYYLNPRAHDHATADGGNLTSILNLQDFSEVSASDRYSFNEANLALGYQFYSSRCLTFGGYAGIRYVNLDDRRHVDGILGDVPPNADQHAETWGVGLIAGGQADWDVWCGMQLFGNLGGSALLGQRRLSTTTFDEENGTISRHFAAHSVCVPSLDLNVGLAYDFCLCCLGVRLEVAYEQHYYVDAMYFGNVFTNDTVATTESIGFGGLRLGGKVAF